MSTTIDDDVKVWVVARRLSQATAEFTGADLLEELRTTFKADPRKMERFVSQQCIANTSGGGDRHFNYLFKVGEGRYRMWRQGDPIEFSHATAPTMPEVSRVPPEYKTLYASTSRFPAGLRPLGTAQNAPEPKPLPSRKDEAASKAKPAGTPPGPTRGLLLDTSGFDERSPANLARRTIFDMLFLEMGKVGSRLESQRSENFVINLEPHAGSVATRGNLTGKLPNGSPTAHEADLVVELDSPTRTLFVDIVESNAAPHTIKAQSFDAHHLRAAGKNRYGVLVFLRAGHGMMQEQAEAVAYPYDFFFGVEALHVKDPTKFYALKSQILQWMNGKVKAERAATTP